MVFSGSAPKVTVHPGHTLLRLPEPKVCLSSTPSLYSLLLLEAFLVFPCFASQTHQGSPARPRVSPTLGSQARCVGGDSGADRGGLR